MDYAMAMTNSRLQGRVAIVTGASRGLGAALAARLAREGVAVVVAARSEQVWNDRLPGTIHETAARIQDEGGRACAVRCDMTVEDDLARVVETATREFGTVDILVHNAAVTVPGRPPAADTSRAPSRSPASVSGSSKLAPRAGFLDFPLRGFRLHFEVNVFAAYRLMQLVLPGMIELGRGSILNVTSDASRRPGEGPYSNPGGTTTFAYGGAKAALEHLTRSVAFEMQGHGIGVNALMPSLPVATPGMLYQVDHLAEEVSMESFCEAAIQLLSSSPQQTTGYIAYSEDVLHPELGRRGWLGH
jgi:NAD(P)-dependent dehydrogenase (short-subunit alcohol dehydrogenase family)